MTRRTTNDLRAAALAFVASQPETPPTWADAQALAPAWGCSVGTAWKWLDRAWNAEPQPRWGGPPDPIAAKMRTILVTSNQVAALPWIEHAITQCFSDAGRRGLEELLAGILVAKGDV